MSRLLCVVVAVALIGHACCDAVMAQSASSTEKVPVVTDRIVVTGEQANALILAVAELEKNKLDVARYVITIYQSKELLEIVFDSPTRRFSEAGAASSGPEGFEVTVSRESKQVVKSHFMR
jgi:hypothetical protein